MEMHFWLLEKQPPTFGHEYALNSYGERLTDSVAHVSKIGRRTGYRHHDLKRVARVLAEALNVDAVVQSRVTAKRVKRGGQTLLLGLVAALPRLCKNERDVVAGWTKHLSG